MVLEGYITPDGVWAEYEAHDYDRRGVERAQRRRQSAVYGRRRQIKDGERRQNGGVPRQRARKGVQSAAEGMGGRVRPQESGGAGKDGEKCGENGSRGRQKEQKGKADGEQKGQRQKGEGEGPRKEVRRGELIGGRIGQRI